MNKILKLNALLFFAMTFTTTQVLAQSLLFTPTEVYVQTEIGQQVEQQINIKVAGLPALSMISSFDLTLQGPDAEFFTANDPQRSLMELLAELMGGGHNVSVTYAPTGPATAEEPHTATLLVTVALLGGIMPVQGTVELNGSTTVPPGPPQVVSTSPVNGNMEVQANQPFITITYNKEITIVNPDLITVNGEPVENPLEEENVLSFDLITPESPVLPSGETFNVVIGAGAIADANGNETVTDYTLNFATLDYPRIISTVPVANSTTVYDPDAPGLIDLVFNFDREVLQGSLGEIVSLNQAFPIQNITFNGNSVTVSLSNNVAIGTSQVQITFQKGSVFDANSNQVLESTYTFYLTAMSSRMIVSEKIFDMGGFELDKNNLRSGNLYIKKVFFSDGTEETRKFFHHN